MSRACFLQSKGLLNSILLHPTYNDITSNIRLLEFKMHPVVECGFQGGKRLERSTFLEFKMHLNFSMEKSVKNVHLIFEVI